MWQRQGGALPWFAFGCHVVQDARETHVVLWYRLGWRGKVGFCPPTEPDARALVRAKI